MWICLKLQSGYALLPFQTDFLSQSNLVCRKSPILIDARQIKEKPLSQVPSLVRDDVPTPTKTSGETYDVFISHASEDKEDIVRPLANALIRKGLKVWYDEMTLKIGDSLRQKIDKGLANSRVGLVVLSPSFIDKGWTN